MVRAKRKSGGELLPAVAAEPASLVVVAGADAGGCDADDVLWLLSGTRQCGGGQRRYSPN